MIFWREEFSAGFWVGGAVMCLALVMLFGGAVFLVQHGLTRSMRVAERGRLFVDFIADCLAEGRPLEESIISLSQSRENSMGIQFHLLAAWLENGLNLDEALERVPKFLPARINSILRVGCRMGDLRKVISVCRLQWSDANSQVSGVINYFRVVGYAIAPCLLWIGAILLLLVFPKFHELVGPMHSDDQAISLFERIFWPVIIAQAIISLLLAYICALCENGGYMGRWIWGSNQIQYIIPWWRKRLLRDFTSILAALLDSGVPEREAILLAGECTDNEIFRRRVREAISSLKRGSVLPDAVRSVDSSGEFAWRMANATHSQTGFTDSLRGWVEALDAKAFQKEQAASQWISTGLVFWYGALVAGIAVTVFSTLISIMNGAATW